MVESSPRNAASHDDNEDTKDDFDKEMDFEEFRLNFPWIKSIKSTLINSEV